MKPAPFEYVSVRSVPEALQALEAYGEDAKVLAGGQSLVPMLNFRLARPSALVDIARIGGLASVEVGSSGVEIGALVTHRRLERASGVPGPLGTLLARVAPVIGHLPIRTRGTFGGSLAHADPASEWCVLASLLDAEMQVASTSGVRAVAAADFFVTVFTPAMEPAELLTSVRLPLLGPQHHVGFAEFSRRAGDFAIVMAMAVLEVVDGEIREARIALGGVADRPVRARTAEATLVGSAPGADVYRVAAAAAADGVSPHEDVHGPAEFRQDLVRAMVRRALVQAVAPVGG